jgi:hypothetical protein
MVSKLPAPDLKGRHILCVSAGPSRVILTLSSPSETRSSAIFFLKSDPFVTRVELKEAPLLSVKDLRSCEMDLIRPKLSLHVPFIAVSTGKITVEIENNEDMQYRII